MAQLGRIFVIFLSVFLGISASAQSIRTTQLTPSTNLQQNSRFNLSQINDGINSDAPPYNGFQARVPTGAVSFELDKAYDVSAFLLWNDINVRLEGIQTFRLDFFDKSGREIYKLPETETKFVQRADGKRYGYKDVQRFEFSVVKKVSRIDLIVTSVFSDSGVTHRPWIEIREIEFEGTPSRKAPVEPDFTTLLSCTPYNIKFFTIEV